MKTSLDELKQFLAIPSLSADPAYQADVERAAAWLSEKLSALGFSAELVPTKGHPIVYAERQVSRDAPTILIYGHYDVQPPDPLELWTTPPFEPTIRDGRIYARGASDDKGQVFAHIAAVEALGTNLRVNVKFVIEGEEEIGSPSLAPFVEANKTKLAADVVLVSDSPMFASGLPSLTYALRGLAYLEIRLEGAAHDLHSGSYGGAAPNPIHAAAHMITHLKDEEGHIQIPGFYDRVRPISDKERSLWHNLPFDPAALAASIGAETLPGEAGYGVLERLWARPTLDANGIWGGYQGEGSKTVIPAQAGFKLSMRLVPDQDPREIEVLTENYLRQIVPQGYRIRVLRHHNGLPAVTPLDSPAVQLAAKALEEAWGKPAAFIREGGSIPIVSVFQETLGAQVILMGLGLSDDNLHAPNEKLDLLNFEKGIAASRAFLKLLEQLY